MKLGAEHVTTNAGAPAEPGARPQAGLDAYGHTKLAHWLLDPLVDLAPPVRAALIGGLDVSFPGIVTSYINFGAMIIVCCILTRSALFFSLLALHIGLSVLRTAGLMLVWRGGAVWRTDFYIFSTLAWCLCEGTVSGAAVYSGLMPLAVLGTATAVAPLGALAARNFPAPRFAFGIVLSIDAPFVLCCTASPDHWLLLMTWFTPGFLLAIWTSIKYYQRLMIQHHEARFASSVQASSDPLTGALNRRGLAEALANGAGTCLTLFYMDLDGFKQVNDRHGHTAGDVLLKLVTARLRAVARAEDSVARLGGDEFSLGAPGLPPAAAETMAARIVAAVSHEPYDLGGGIVARVGVSVGYACSPEDGVGIEALSARADAALYEVKQRGKGSWQRAAAA
jgi:diguanylate cyclase (GGDEF)-like protein